MKHLKDGKYVIRFHDVGHAGGQEEGSFHVVGGEIKDCTGLAEEVIGDGPVDAMKLLLVHRLSNGYRSVEWERPVASPKKETPRNPKGTVSSL